MPGQIQLIYWTASVSLTYRYTTVTGKDVCSDDWCFSCPSAAWHWHYTGSLWCSFGRTYDERYKRWCRHGVFVDIQEGSCTCWSDGCSNQETTHCISVCIQTECSWWSWLWRRNIFRVNMFLPVTEWVSMHLRDRFGMAQRNRGKRSSAVIMASRLSMKRVVHNSLNEDDTVSVSADWKITVSSRCRLALVLKRIGC